MMNPSRFCQLSRAKRLAHISVQMVGSRRYKPTCSDSPNTLNTNAQSPYFLYLREFLEPNSCVLIEYAMVK